MSCLFAMGLKSIPPAGMTPHPCITFSQESMYPMAKMCANTIKLPLANIFSFQSKYGLWYSKLTRFWMNVKSTKGEWGLEQVVLSLAFFWLPDFLKAACLVFCVKLPFHSLPVSFCLWCLVQVYKPITSFGPRYFLNTTLFQRVVFWRFISTVITF